MTRDNENIGGFKTLWLQYEEKRVKHQIFLKEHSVRKQELKHPKGQTLFVLNIPPYATTDSLKRIFSHLCGPVRLVEFEKKTNGFKTAYIVFEHDSSIDRALSLAQDVAITLNTEENLCETGLTKWCKEYNASLTNEAEMKKDIETYMSEYDKRVEKRLAQEKKQAMDKEGWVTVSSKKKRGQFATVRKESTISAMREKQEESNKKKELLNFYTFQIRESKKQNLAELRKKYELDKKRLQQLKVKRTFKPF